MVGFATDVGCVTCNEASEDSGGCGECVCAVEPGHQPIFALKLV